MKIDKTRHFYKFLSQHLSNKVPKPSDDVLLFTHETARRYYKLNVPFLAGYLVFSYILTRHPDCPSYLKYTSIAFSSIIGLALVGISLYANRHINRIVLKRSTNELDITTFSKLGFGSRRHTIGVNDLREMYSVGKYIKTKKTGVYVIKFNEDKKRLYRYLNLFFIRPSRNNPDFDRIFKRILKY
jgi:hypothetical protein